MDDWERNLGNLAASTELKGKVEAQVVLNALLHWLERTERLLDHGAFQKRAELAIFRTLVERAE